MSEATELSVTGVPSLEFAPIAADVDHDLGIDAAGPVVEELLDGDGVLLDQ